MNNPALILIITSGLALVIGDLVLMKWVNGGSRLLFYVGIAVYMVGMVLLASSYKYKNVAIASLMTVLFNVIILLVACLFLYHEKISLLQIVGIAVGLISLTLLEIG